MSSPAAALEVLELPASPHLESFVRAAARAGLDAERGVCLGLERELVLRDAAVFGLEAETARRILRRAAVAARPRLAVPPQLAQRVRSLQMPRPRAAIDVSEGLLVTVPDRLLARVPGQIPASALRQAAVPEMVGWEIAATLQGRTMGEWALRALAER